MNDVERWIYVEGPEPESLRPFLDTIRDAPLPTPEHKARQALRCFAAADAVLARMREEGPEPEEKEKEKEKEEEHEGAGDAATVDFASPRPDMVRRVPEDGATVRSPTFDERPPTSPEQSAADLSAAALPAPPAMAPAPPVDAGPRAPSAFAITKPSQDDLALEARKYTLPFNPSPPVPPPGQGVARTTELSVVGRVQGETRPLTGSPLTGSTVGAGAGSFPTLNVKQYASFCTDLAFWPAHAAQTFHKYGVRDEAARAAMDEEWRTQFAKLPTLWAEFAQARAEYEAWLWARRG